MPDKPAASAAVASGGSRTTTPATGMATGTITVRIVMTMRIILGILMPGPTSFVNTLPILGVKHQVLQLLGF